MTRLTASLAASVLLLAAGTTWGQVSPAEAQRRMEERQAARITVPATAPATAPAAGSGAATRGPIYHWTAKDGAPAYVQDWIASQADIQRSSIANATREEKTRLGQDLESAKARVKDLEAHANFRHTAGSGYGQKDYVDRAAEAEWSRKYREAKQSVGNLTRQLKATDESEEQKLAEAQQDPRIMTELVAARNLDELKVGRAGRIGMVKVDEVVDVKNMIVRWDPRDEGGGSLLWCRGFSTEGVVDDQRKSLEGCRITGTIKRGGSTMFIAEPFDIADWIQLVDEHGQPAPAQPAAAPPTPSAPPAAPADSVIHHRATAIPRY